ncbi:MATE family efflux transporter [Butyrivibrio sp. LC3010]|uniref:MATE family efflux transporter n=1 Tax=Butyrivibrio sp. LC3010 TaxID=1280680 RepID=UPI0004086A14|nr:MATE family efflux transporter [Butyrivibrio sp. LC3010]
MHQSNKVMLEKLFFKMLPVQILIFAMGAVNTIVDGAIAGRFVDPVAVGVVGLFFPVVNLLNAISAVMLGGTAVLCGRFMGSGDMEKTNGIFSLTITFTTILGAVLTVLSFLFPTIITGILGASPDLSPLLASYIRGYAIGIVPMLLAQQVSSFLQLERQTTRGYIGVATMIVSNIALDIALVAVFKMGIWGLALATSICNWIYLFILISYYFTGRSQLSYKLQNALWDKLIEQLKIGSPGAMLVLCLAFRGIVLNRIVLSYGGEDGLSAMSAFNMSSGIFIAYCLGNGAVIRMLCSVFIGEEDKDSIKHLMKIVLTKGLALSVAIGVIIFLLSPVLAGIFFPDTTSNVYSLTKSLFMIFSICIPLILVCQINTNYLQAAGHNLFINILSVFDGFISMVAASLILAPIMGIMGIWIANPVGIILTILTVPVYLLLYWKRFPRNIDECLFMKPDFGVSDNDRLDIEIKAMDEVTNTAASVQEFCENHGVPHKPAFYSALCIEEMAGNVVLHGFTKDKASHTVNIRVVYRSDSVLLRIKDDCIPFNPKERADLISGDDPFKNIGIRMITKLADDVTYQNMLGLNVLTIVINHSTKKVG